VPLTLHLVARATADSPHPFYFDLLEQGQSRVVELFEAARNAALIDLSLAERDVPEVIAALHWAEEVHAYGIHPELVLRVLPAVREEALRKTTLVFHGSWAPLPETLRSLAVTRLSRWPGPARYDARGDVEDIRPLVDGPIECFPPTEFLDPHRAELLPRICGARPIRLDDGRWLATVMLSAGLEETLRKSLQHLLPTVGLSGVIVQTCDEASESRGEWAEMRRAVQAYIAPARFSYELLEATLQEIPIIALESPGVSESNLEDLPPDAVRLGGRGNVGDRVVSCVRSWVSRWAEGQAGPVDPVGRKVFTERWLGATGPRGTWSG